MSFDKLPLGAIYIYIEREREDPNDPCFYWKGPCFGGLKPKNRGHTGSRYIYIYIIVYNSHIMISHDNFKSQIDKEVRCLLDPCPSPHNDSMPFDDCNSAPVCMVDLISAYIIILCFDRPAPVI